MPSEIVLQQSVHHDLLSREREQLAAVRIMLAERTAALNGIRSELKIFEDRYFREAGVLYAELDLLEAQIAEREVDLYDSSTARERAKEAKQRADQSRKAASEHDAEPVEFDPSPSLRTLYRDVAKRIHPDFARNDEEAQYFTLLMARANQAYRRGDTEILERMLQDHGDPAADSNQSDAAAESTRVSRHVQQARRDLAAVDAEREELFDSEIARLYADSQMAALDQRDLVGELATALRDQIVDAHLRLERIDRQITAHGR